MRQFYELVQVDKESLQFCVPCPICGKIQYGAKLPLLCRGIRILAKCEVGRAGKLSQRAYNHARAKSVQLIAMHFNQCRHCCRWVCDDCYDISDSSGACRHCVEKKE